MRSILVVLISLTACSFDPPPSVDEDANGGGDDAGDIDAGIDANRDCQPSTTTCTADTLTVCDAQGTVESTTACALGCAATGDRCNALDPSNGLASALDMTGSAPDIVLALTSTDTTINTDTGDVVHGGAPVVIPSALVTQSGGNPSIRVFRVKSLAIRNRVRVTGSAAVAFVSAGDVEIAANLVVAARNNVAGPGAHATCQGANVTANLTTNLIAGAGGGGFGTAGSAGGKAQSGSGGTQTGGAAGLATGSPDLVPLRGGCKGGTVLSPNDAYFQTAGGGGGGGLQIVSATQITVTSARIIDAGGGGNAYGKTGGAGGAGGGILLEAPVVTVDGVLAANGGAGGCFNNEGEDGQTAYRSGSLAALGGNCTEANYVADGGNGGTKDAAPTAGGGSVFSGTNGGTVVMGGGGAGAVGRIRVNTRSSDFAAGASSLVSPLPAKGPVAVR